MPSPPPPATLAVDCECEETDEGAVDAEDTDCADYYELPSWTCGELDDDDFSATSMYCAFGGGAEQQSPSQRGVAALVLALAVIHFAVGSLRRTRCTTHIQPGMPSTAPSKASAPDPA